MKPPSAELRPDQKDSDSLPDYSILDQILFQHIELKRGSNALIAQGFEEELVKRVLKMVNQAEFKRYQTPPILRLGRNYKKARLDQMGKPVRRLTDRYRKIREDNSLGSASVPSQVSITPYLELTHREFPDHRTPR